MYAPMEPEILAPGQDVLSVIQHQSLWGLSGSASAYHMSIHRLAMVRWGRNVPRAKRTT